MESINQLIDLNIYTTDHFSFVMNSFSIEKNRYLDHTQQYIAVFIYPCWGYIQISSRFNLYIGFN